MKNSTLSRLVIALTLCLAMSTARAQYISIPDTSFGNWLNGHGYAAAMTGNSTSGWQLNTASTLVTSATSIDCHYSNIRNLTGISAFTNLTYLNCAANKVYTLPTLPSTLKSLYIGGDSLSTLPALPAGLKRLDFNTNQITNISSLPATLTYLNCSYNLLTSMPALPSTIDSIDCYDNNITSLGTLPAGLKRLMCSGNNFPTLPALPSTLQELQCESGGLTGLPTLPVGIKIVDVSNNHGIRTLPALPAGLLMILCSADSLSALPVLPTSLNVLDCSANQLTSLPTLSNVNMHSLDCSYNPITVIPTLPPTAMNSLICKRMPLTGLPSLPSSLTYLDCSFCGRLSSLPLIPYSLLRLIANNDSTLTCLPPIYQNLTACDIDNTAITCVPTRFGATNFYQVNPALLPLCDGSSGCDFFYDIAGTIHMDTSADCQLDSLHPGTPVTGMKVRLWSGGNVIQQQYALSTGGYSFNAPSFGSYQVDIDTAGVPVSVVCPQSGVRAITLSAADSVKRHEGFGMHCSAVDFGVVSMEAHRFRPTFATTVHINAGNIALLSYNANCGSGTSGTVTTTWTNAAHYVSPGPGALTPTSVSGNVLTYNLADLNTLQSGSLDIILSVDAGAVAGSSLCVTTTVSSATPDLRPVNDTLTQCYTILNSWDPNYKEAYPTTLSQNGDWLTYTIHFQNTGNDTAYLVVLRDTLSANVDPSSFQYLRSSHKALVQLFDRAMVFTFPKINLVDSATNPPLSEGWIQYRVKSNSSLAIGTQVTNTAYIYFDSNPAVATNTASSVVDTAHHSTVGIATTASVSDIHLYPNPNTGTFTLTTSNSRKLDYTITNMLGDVIEQKAITADTQTIDMSYAAAGVYTLYVKGARPVRFTVVR